MLNRSASLAMSTSVLKALPGKLDIKRHSPGILYLQTRSGIPIIHAYGLEKLLYEHGVDLEVWAHEHNYERFWPVYDRKVKYNRV